MEHMCGRHLARYALVLTRPLPFPFTYSPTTIGQIENLMDLQLNNNEFVGTLPSEIGNCVKLEKLEIQENQLTGPLPSEIGDLDKLFMLKVYGNQFVGSVPAEVCDLKGTSELAFVAADCNGDNGGTVQCDCCNTCYP